MLITKKLFNLRDITIIPSTISNINSRSECDPLTEGLHGELNYPIIVSPMSSVVNNINYKTFTWNKISSIIPRNIELSTRLSLCTKNFCAFSLSEIKEHFLNPLVSLYTESTYYILIDIANGHMKEQIETGKALKALLGNRVKLMGGNIANPDTYTYYDLSGFDYVRVGIAGGSRCITGTQTGIFYPMASLINETAAVKGTVGKCKIIADGGISSYSDIIKCLALGADFAMAGNIFAKALEACGPVFDADINTYFDVNRPEILRENLFRDYYGMSTKRAQCEIGTPTSLKTSEGKDKRVPIEYTLDGWVDNFSSYLRSAMSYCNSTNLNEFRKNTRCQVISEISSIDINNK